MSWLIFPSFAAASLASKNLTTVSTFMLDMQSLKLNEGS